ncbi:hypothetical protein JKP88DRAFT_274161 [Tribonema minus]|uniref:Uncharacterized protein n=1 Tax=Tribonema minus TaxID=303371 RepID=A0A835YLD6_9STRA|nr:hypothetical protein JKP88DRAFT_274161 [Tribonema minus]
MSKATSFKNICPTGLSIENNVKTSKVGRLIFAKHDDKNLIFQTPKLSLAWDADARLNKFGKVNCCLPLSLSGEAALPFKRWLVQVECEIKRLIGLNRTALLGDTSPIYLERMSIVKEPASSGRHLSTTVLPRMPFDDESLLIKTPVVDPSGKRLDAEEVLKKDAEVIAILRLEFIHVGDDSVSVRLVTEKVCVFPKKEIEFDFSEV